MPLVGENWAPVETVGVMHPPFVYRPGQWKWHYFKSCEEALHQALRASGIDRPVDQIRQSVHAANNNSTQSGSAVLFHPANHASSPFEDEAGCATVATSLNHSLVVVCPVTNPGVESLEFWEPKAGQLRPSLRARWSTGYQSHLYPVVVGALQMYRQSNIMWFALEPVGGFRLHWAKPSETIRYILYCSFTTSLTVLSQLDVWEKLRTRLNIPPQVSVETFKWVVVAAHRSIMLRTGDVRKNGNGHHDYAISEWIHKYTRHLVNKKHGKPFNVKDGPEYKDWNISFLEFHNLVVVRPDLDFWKRRWNESIRKFLVYNQNQNDTTWSAFRRAYEDAGGVSSSCIRRLTHWLC